MQLPRINSYGQYKSDNYGAHTLVVEVGPITVWYSYRTPVAFQVGVSERVVRHNSWGPTTGKHLNWIDGGDYEALTKRVGGTDFQEKWDEQVAPILTGV